MSLGVKLAAFAAAIVLAGSAFADDQSCPNLADIQAEGISSSELISNNYFIGYAISNFNSSSTWGFAIGPVQADSNDDAIETSNEILMNMTAPGLPLQMDYVTVCLYDTGNPYVYSIAVKDWTISPMKLKQYIHKAY